MSGKRYTDEFKIEAVEQVTGRGHSVADMDRRFGIATHSLYACEAGRVSDSIVKPGMPLLSFACA